MLTSGNHREAAEQALASAQRNPVLSVTETFLAAQVHALLAIEQRVSELLGAHAQHLFVQEPRAQPELV